MIILQIFVFELQTIGFYVLLTHGNKTVYHHSRLQ